METHAPVKFQQVPPVPEDLTQRASMHGRCEQDWIFGWKDAWRGHERTSRTVKYRAQSTAYVDGWYCAYERGAYGLGLSTPPRPERAPRTPRPVFGEGV